MKGIIKTLSKNPTFQMGPQEPFVQAPNKKDMVHNQHFKAKVPTTRGDYATINPPSGFWVSPSFSQFLMEYGQMGKREKRDKDEPHCLVLINSICGTHHLITSFKHNPNPNSSTFQSMHDTYQYL